MALERFFKDLSNGHEFFIDQAFGLVTISKTSCPEFSVATVMLEISTLSPPICLHGMSSRLAQEKNCFRFRRHILRAIGILNENPLLKPPNNFLLR